MTTRNLPLSFIRITLTDLDGQVAKKKEVITEKLQALEGRCRDGYYILKATLAQPLSKIRVVVAPFELDVRGYMSVGYKAVGLRYEPGDLLAACNIVKRDQGNIIVGKTQYADIILRNSPQTERAVAFKVGDMIPIIVVDSRYQPQHTRITMSALPLDVTAPAYMNTNIPYKMDGPWPKPEFFIPYKEMITTLEKNSRAVDQKTYDFVRTALTPPVAAPATGPAPVSIFNITQDQLDKAGSVLTDSRVDGFFSTDITVGAMDNTPPISRRTEDFISYIIGRAVMRLTFLQDMCVTYSPTNEILWKFIAGSGASRV